MYRIITTKNPPIEIIPQRTGIADNILHNSGELVSDGNPLLYFQNTAEPGHVDSLRKLIAQDYSETINILLPEEWKLGVISATYSAWIKEIKTWRRLYGNTSVLQQLQVISREIEELKKLNHSLEKEKVLFAKEMQLVAKDLDRNQALNKEKVVSDLDVEQVEKSHLQYRRQYESMQSGIIQNNIRMEQLNLQAHQLREERNNLLAGQELIVRNLHTGLQEEIHQWYESNYLYAEYPGHLEWNSTVTAGKVIQAGNLLGYILPDSETNVLVARAYVPTEGAGKVEIGDQAILRLHAYPYKEYGSIETAVQSISSIPVQVTEQLLGYEVVLAIADSMVTDYGKFIPYQPNMDVSIQLITKSNNIIGRIFNQLYAILKNT